VGHSIAQQARQMASGLGSIEGSSPGLSVVGVIGLFTLIIRYLKDDYSVINYFIKIY